MGEIGGIEMEVGGRRSRSNMVGEGSPTDSYVHFGINSVKIK